MKKKLIPFFLIAVLIGGMFVFSSCSIFEGFAIKGIWNGSFEEVSYSFDFQTKSGGFFTRAGEIYPFSYSILDNTLYYLWFDLPAVPENLLGEIYLNITNSNVFLARLTWDHGATWTDTEEFKRP